MAASACASACRIVRRPPPSRRSPPTTSSRSTSRSRCSSSSPTNPRTRSSPSRIACTPTSRSATLPPSPSAGSMASAIWTKSPGFVEKTETSDALRIASEVDRVYLNATGTVEILDPRLGRDPRGEAGVRFHGGLEPVDCQGAADARLRRRGIRADDLCRIGQCGFQQHQLCPRAAARPSPSS